VFLAGSEDLVEGGFHFGVVHLTTDTERLGKVIGADEEDVDAGCGGDGVEVCECAFFFDDDYRHDVAIGEGGVAFWRRPAEAREASGKPAAAFGRILGSRSSLLGEFGGRGEGEDDADGAHVEGTFGGPQFVDGDADEGHRFEAAGGEDHVARGFKSDGGMFHLDPDEVEAHVGHLGGNVDAGDGDGSGDDWLAFFE